MDRRPRPPAEPPAPRRSGNPPLGLDGYCPVQLCDDMVAQQPKWRLGNREWGAIYRDRTYLFTGLQQQRRFLADPDRYAPVMSGNDVVMAIDHGKTIAGKRAHGAFCGEKIYLFANDANLQKFVKNYEHYMTVVLESMRTLAAREQQQQR